AGVAPGGIQRRVHRFHAGAGRAHDKEARDARALIAERVLASAWREEERAGTEARRFAYIGAAHDDLTRENIERLVLAGVRVRRDAGTRRNGAFDEAEGVAGLRGARLYDVGTSEHVER